jgi:hypothetical protein
MGLTYEAENGNLSENLRKQLNLLMTTPVGTVVLDRDFGIDTSFLDQAVPAAQSELAAELAVKIEKYIPELTLKEVRRTGADTNGHVNTKVVVAYAE